MFLKGSRYENASLFYADDNGEVAFDGVRAREIGKATGVIEHIVREGDRLDLLARHYYNNDRHWWRIIDANPEIMFATDLLLDDWLGQTILIPKIRE